MSLVILHLSDIHFKSAADPICRKAEHVAKAVFPMLPEATSVVVVVSGDIAFSGKQLQYEAAERFLIEIKSHIEREKNITVNFIVCPGNHDCDFSNDDMARKLIVSSVSNATSTVAIDDSVIEACTKIQNDFYNFQSRMHSDLSNKVGDRLWFSADIEIEGKTVVFDSINAAWISQLHEDQGALAFPFARYLSKENEPCDLRIAVLHQPLNWFGQSTYRPFRQFLRRLANLTITGHEHIGLFGENTDSESGTSAYIEGWVLQGERDLSDSSFSIVEIQLETQSYRTLSHRLHADAYVPEDIGSWLDYRNIPVKQNAGFPVQPDFIDLIRDPGGNFRTSIGGQVTLEDLYVFPDINSHDENSIGGTLSSSVLRDKTWISDGVLLEGEEKAGATSLLYRLFDCHHEAGGLPIYIRGGDIKSASTRDLEGTVKKAFRDQYGERNFVNFEQLPKEKKILLLDDFDDSTIKSPQLRSNVISFFNQRFGSVIISVGELFGIEDLLSTPESDCLKSYKKYRIRPFGYGRRLELIKRWFRLVGRDGSLSEDDFIARCEYAERLFNNVMDRNIVPSLPLYLLTLLQAADSGVAGSFQESALGQYYGFLLNESLKSAGIPPQKWEAVVEYCSHLAWKFHSTSTRELDGITLLEFNRDFERNQHTVDFESRMNELLRARILVRSGDYFRFRYHYIFYYLKGRYLSKRLGTTDIQAYIKRCCKHLYARENANTILFLAHHAYSDEFFLQCVTDALNHPFSGGTESRFDGSDTSNVAKLVASAPKLKYTGETPEEHKKRLNDERDRTGSISDGLSDREESTDELSLAAQVACTAKTVEILGQVLKNQYAVIDRRSRVDILGRLIKGPLRAIHAVLDEAARTRDAILAELEEQLERKSNIGDMEKRGAMAQRILAHIIQTAAFGFVLRTANALSSRDLMEDIRAAAREINTPAARLIELAVRLDTPDPLPKDTIVDLASDVRADIVGGNMIRQLILQRLYMYRMTPEDKQWLASQGILDIRRSGAISYRAIRAGHSMK